MAADKTVDECRQIGRMEDILLERERLDQVLKDRFRKQVTLFFSDLCDYTRYTDQRGDIQSRTLLIKYNRLVLPAIDMHAGRVIEIIGDGIMAAFDDPVNAGKAAIEIQNALKTHNDQTPVDDQIHVKIGINSGDALMDEDAAYQCLTGDVANVAARIQSRAQKDQILLSQSVYDQIRGCNEFLIHFHAKVQIKGKTGDMPIYRLAWSDDPVVFDGAAKVRMPMDDAGPAESVATILNLDLNLDGRDLKISVSEARSGEKRTISHYESISVSMDTIDTRCRQLVNTLNKANRRGRVSRQVLVKLREIGQVLYDELLTFSVKETLRSSRSDTLILKIDDQLVHIPWELLYDGRQFLCLRFSMGRVVKTRQPIAGVIHRKIQRPLGMLILADPTGDLKGAYAEGMEIRDFMDQSPDLVNVSLRSGDATAENIKTKLRNFDIVHFAGHSDYDTSCPDTSGWRLQGGSLCTGDITKMAGSETMPAMIFANACQSARADQWTLDASFESKIFGLANAFLVAGVTHYIGTFWEVPDQPCSRFAIEFYKYLLADHRVGDALRNARQTLIDLYGEETIVWASYVLYGDPTFDYMAHLRTASATIPGLASPDPIKPFEKDRTREEVIDFSEGRSWLALARRWVVAMVILLSAGLGAIGWSWYVNRGVRAVERQAMADFLSGDFTAAEKLSRQVQEKIPGSPISSLILGNVYLSRGDKDLAGRYFQSVVDSDNASPTIQSDALMGLARVSSIVQDPEQALALYQRAAVADPQSARPLTAQAVLLERQRRDEEALRLYEQALIRFPDDRGVQLAARDIRDRLSEQQDQVQQARIDKLVEELLDSKRRTAASVTDANRWSSTPLSVWLMDFEEAGFSLQEGQGRTVHMLVRDLLTKNPRVRVVERAVLDKLLAELKLGASQLAHRQTALSIGRLMATRVLLPGQIQYADGEALVSIRAIDCETGLISASVVESYLRSQTPMDIAQDMARRVATSLTAAFPIRTRVSQVNGNQIVLDIGQRAGVQTGQVFAGVDTDVILQVTSVGDNHSTAAALRGEHAIAAGIRLQEKIQDASTSID
jgi:class 3 adenylate cyclase/CHAT domain-containing protein